tara:strand:- start:4529 stop:4699 length:171 start_codon:yes stop_codon:yes gene_type:complete
MSKISKAISGFLSAAVVLAAALNLPVEWATPEVIGAAALLGGTVVSGVVYTVPNGE